MDEILIEEKKYVSSKRAAGMTGYAKDYIGQLCREGRVPARLIGRSWYVLEAAIQDHRFGTESEPEEAVNVPVASMTSTWESPLYEASPEAEDILPTVNRIKEENVDQNATQHIQDSWKEWFDHFTEEPDVSGGSVGPEKAPDEGTKEEPINEKEPEENIAEPEIEKDTKVNVPIHTIHRPLYQAPPEELLPRYKDVHTSMVSEEEDNYDEPAQKTGHKRSFRVAQVVQIVGIALAILVASTAVIGSGYFDKYILSSSPTRIMAGVGLYNRK